MTTQTRRKALSAPKQEQAGVLGTLTPEEFLRDYWQKKPLLIRQTITGFGDALPRDALLELARREDVESRFVAHDSTEWQVTRGPFSKAQQKRWKGKWTVLIQGVNLVFPFGDQLLKRFNFIPHARLDDLMVSYATDGGGVGPHIDNYDVFLLQGTGRRRWRIGKQTDQRLIEGAPLKILRDFQPEHDWILEPGDMLYLPPDWAHDGTAEGECMTWSIGFRTAPAQELAAQFLDFLQDHLADNSTITGRYADPDLQRQEHPGEISEAMVRKVSELLRLIQWDEALVRDFLGASLSEPKAHVFFDAPEPTLSLAAFGKRVKKDGLHLDARSRMLFAQGAFYLNGETVVAPPESHAALISLADLRELRASTLAQEAANTPLFECLYDWYECGFLHPGT